MNCMNDGRLTDLYEMSSSSHLYTETERTSVSYAEFTRGAKSPWISHRRYSTKLRKFLRPQQPTKLSGFMRESGEFLPLFISLLFTVVDVAVLTFSMLMFKFAVCKGAKHSQIVVNRNRMSDISYPGHPNSSTVTSFYNLTPSAPTNSDPNFLQPWNIYTDMKSTCSNVSLHRIKLHSLSFNVASPVVINVKRAALRSWNKGHGEPFGHKFSHCRHDLWPKKTHLAGVKMRSVSGSCTRRRKMIVRAATCERDAPSRLCMLNLMNSRPVPASSFECSLNLHAFVCARRWSEWIRDVAGPSWKGSDLCGDLSDRGGQRRWALILRSDFLAWRNVHRYYTRTVRIERVSSHFHRHIIVRERVSRARLVSARPSSGFSRLEPFLFNEFAAENECALYNSLWLNPLVKAARYNSQFILLYHLLQLNILWVDSSPGARFLSQSVNYAHSDGTWLESIRGTDKAELCVGRIGRFMWRQMSASVVTSLRVL